MLLVTFSIGYVYGTIRSSTDLHEAIRLADRKAYEAKRKGKARAVGASLDSDIAAKSMHHEHHNMYRAYETDELTGLANLIHFRTSLDKMLRARDERYDETLKHHIVLKRYVLDHFDEALENGWVKIFYQPIIRVATGAVCDEEALARWVDPVEGLLPPFEFIPVLEEARLIHQLDLYIVRRACSNFSVMRENGMSEVPISVNLSRLDFELCDIVSEVEAILEEFDVPRNMLSARRIASQLDHGAIAIIIMS